MYCFVLDMGRVGCKANIFASQFITGIKEEGKREKGRKEKDSS